MPMGSRYQVFLTGLFWAAVSGAYMNRCEAQSSSSSNIPNRSDPISLGDKIKMQVDAPIFSAFSKDTTKTTKGEPKVLCAPAGSYFEIETVPTPKMETSVTSASGANTPTTIVSGSSTSSTVTATEKGDKIETTTKVKTVVTFLRTNPSWIDPLVGNKFTGTCVASAADGNPYDVVKTNVPYELATDDLASYRNHRFGWTYGGLVVPNKLQISDRSFTSSTSIFPYVGYENWGTGVSGTIVLAAGVGTVPAQSTSTPGTTTTRAVFSIAAGEIFKFGTIFRAGFVMGTDTSGSKTGYKYQGKPWIGITLGAGS